MKYQGGKTKIAKPIVEAISQNLEICVGGQAPIFVSLFCGSCAVESRISGFQKKILNDKHEYLIELLKGVQSGYELPDCISEGQYKYIREHKDEDRILTGFVGFGCSFGGKWFGGYARDGNGRNYTLEAKKSLLRDMQGLKDAEFLCGDYRDVDLPDGCVVYADPPYAGTTGYAVGKFDSEEFWKYMRKISQDHIVFISEESAPTDFEAIWSKSITRTLDVNKKNQPKRIEKLFVHKKYADRVNMIKAH